MELKRSSGVLLHPTSLPSPWGVGDLGPSAYKLLDLMETARQSVWQILPLTPVAMHGSPYSAHSLFAGNPLLLSPEKLAEDGFIDNVPSKVGSLGEGRAVDYGRAFEFKERLVGIAFSQSFSRTRAEDDYVKFLQNNSEWIDDYALYEGIRKEQGRPWYQWPEELRRRDSRALREKKEKLATTVELAVFAQYLFYKQWSSLAGYARSKEIKILGDVPFYVQHDSADIWSHQDLFNLDGEGVAHFVGGVPPDYFSKTGQRWGNPVYQWDRMEATGYGWWKDRVRRSLALTGMVRLDHFRGYVAYWEIPRAEQTAVKGRWVEVPRGFIDFIPSAFPDLPFVAEDLGVITNEVNEARDRLGIPGMRVLQFGFDGSTNNVHFPQSHTKNCFVYTSTHDTNTVLGWFREEAKPKEKEEISNLVSHSVTEVNVCDDFVAMAMSSVADVTVVSMQDLLCLGRESRMNNPATTVGNWIWRMLPGELSEGIFRELGGMTSKTGRG